jgi:hypothetical protein
VNKASNKKDTGDIFIEELLLFKERINKSVNSVQSKLPKLDNSIGGCIMEHLPIENKIKLEVDQITDFLRMAQV